MKKFRISIRLSLLVLVALVLSAGHRYLLAGEKNEAKARRARTVLYQVKEDAGEKEKAALAALLGKYDLKTTRKLVAGRIHQGDARAKEAPSEEQLAAELAQSGAVEFAEPDYRVSPANLPNDPGYPSQWFHEKIRSSVAWDVTVGSSSVIVAVCDTGIDASHPDLSANLKLPGYNTVDGTSNTADINSHGTATAGCVGAVGNNGTGVSGVAWNIKILPVRVTNDPSGAFTYYSDMAEAITWSADQGAKVVTMSYMAWTSSTVDAGAQYLRNKGGLYFASAGNSSADLSSSYSDFTSTIVVGATDSFDFKASWSNYGTPIDLVAPGVGIYTTALGGGYRSESGTSFSAPIAAGVAALIYSINPSFTPTQVENFIFSTCADLGTAGDDSVYGHGRVDAAAAVLAARNFVGNLAPVIDSMPWANPNPVALPNSTTASVIASDPDLGPSELTYTWSKLSGPGTVSFSPNGTTGSAISTASFSASGSYTLRVSISDGAASSSGDLAVTVNPDPNKSMHISSLVMSLTSNKSGTLAYAKVTIVDQNGAALAGATVTGFWSGVVSGTSSGTTTTAGTATLKSPKTRSSGTFTFTVTNVSLSGYTYNPASNLQSSASITKP